MTGIETTALVVLGAWTGVLTLAVLLSVRQIALLTHRVNIANEFFSFAHDGPEVGLKLSPALRAAIPALNEQMPTYLLNISATCAPCRELAVELGGRPFDERVVALLSGSDELASAVIELLPESFSIIRDPQATELAELLQIKSTPFTVVVEGGFVVGKSYVNSVSDLERLHAANEKGRVADPSRNGRSAVAPSTIREEVVIHGD
jgi:hypothetical protein